MLIFKSFHPNIAASSYTVSFPLAPMRVAAVWRGRFAWITRLMAA